MCNDLPDGAWPDSAIHTLAILYSVNIHTLAYTNIVSNTRRYHITNIVSNNNSNDTSNNTSNNSSNNNSNNNIL